MGDGIQKQFEKHPLNTSIEWRLLDSHKQTQCILVKFLMSLFLKTVRYVLQRKAVYVCMHAYI